MLLIFPETETETETETISSDSIASSVGITRTIENDQLAKNENDLCKKIRGAIYSDDHNRFCKNIVMYD